MPDQRRFVHDSLDSYLRLLERLRDKASLGVAPHSLRAVPPEQIPELVSGVDALLGADCPIHIHISEQTGEVDACRTHYGRTPIELLADHVELDARWSLVHATHASAAERRLIRERGANVVLCPLTEAYLGDGLFEVVEHMRAGGRFAIGSDSNIRADACEELRWLEFGQRLIKRQRAQLAGSAGLGVPLWLAAADGGAQALGEPRAAIEVGRPADLVVLDEAAAPLAGHEENTLLDVWLIGGSRADILAVYVAGDKRVDHGELVKGPDPSPEFAATVCRLLSS